MIYRVCIAHRFDLACPITIALSYSNLTSSSVRLKYHGGGGHAGAVLYSTMSSYVRTLYDEYT